jgi:hypothetical protein
MLPFRVAKSIWPEVLLQDANAARNSAITSAGRLWNATQKFYLIPSFLANGVPE